LTQRASLAALLSFAALAACAEERTPAAEAPATEAPSRATSTDAERIARAISDDPARASLAEVDAALDQDLPVRAAELLSDSAIPAARESLERARVMEVDTAEGGRMREALVSALDARVRALEQKASALERGMVEDLALADAFRAERAAEEQLVAVVESLATTREGAVPAR
jgi:hypothetical protein